MVIQKIIKIVSGVQSTKLAHTNQTSGKPSNAVFVGNKNLRSFRAISHLALLPFRVRCAFIRLLQTHSNMTYPLFTRVVLAERLPQYSLPAGTPCTIIEYFEPTSEDNEARYEVEIFDRLGNPLDAIMVRESQVAAA
jgi:hypothetical protein